MKFSTVIIGSVATFVSLAAAESIQTKIDTPKSYKVVRWPSNTVSYYFDGNLPLSSENKVTTAIRMLRYKLDRCITFSKVPAGTPGAVRVTRGRSGDSTVIMGYQGKGNKNTLTLDISAPIGDIIHEFGHYLAENGVDDKIQFSDQIDFLSNGDAEYDRQLYGCSKWKDENFKFPPYDITKSGYYRFSNFDLFKKYLEKYYDTNYSRLTIDETSQEGY
eukprot:Pgem_evm2s8079